jgi:hypothetical protein
MAGVLARNGAFQIALGLGFGPAPTQPQDLRCRQADALVPPWVVLLVAFGQKFATEYLVRYRFVRLVEMNPLAPVQKDFAITEWHKSIFNKYLFGYVFFLVASSFAPAVEVIQLILFLIFLCLNTAIIVIFWYSKLGFRDKRHPGISFRHAAICAAPLLLQMAILFSEIEQRAFDISGFLFFSVLYLFLVPVYLAFIFAFVRNTIVKRK